MNTKQVCGLIAQWPDREWDDALVSALVRGRNKSKAEINAQVTLNAGKGVDPPRSSPFRVLARTCDGCGVVITTSMSRLRRDSGEIDQCKPCGVSASTRYERRKRKEQDPVFLAARREHGKRKAHTYQSETLDNARNHGKEWTGPELEIASRQDLTIRQKASMLGRSYYSVKTMVQRVNGPVVDPRKTQMVNGRTNPTPAHRNKRLHRGDAP